MADSNSGTAKSPSDRDLRIAGSTSRFTRTVEGGKAPEAEAMARSNKAPDARSPRKLEMRHTVTGNRHSASIDTNDGASDASAVVSGRAVVASVVMLPTLNSQNG
ncbi:hypothetical protein ACFXN2_05865 [Streptomyces kronopolitis]|uniref:hypothetical protein n=1 Tax=Streptomyces kronopolitis TaxID=1612435 RepID=UPI0036BCF7B8